MVGLFLKSQMGLWDLIGQLWDAPALQSSENEDFGDTEVPELQQGRLPAWTLTKKRWIEILGSTCSSCPSSTSLISLWIPQDQITSFLSCPRIGNSHKDSDKVRGALRFPLQAFWGAMSCVSPPLALWILSICACHSVKTGIFWRTAFLKKNQCFYSQG